MADVKVMIVSSMMTRAVLDSIADALSNRGLSVAVSGDAAAEITGVDCVIFHGTGLDMPNLTRRLEAQGPDRPAVIVWLSEPLPPDGTTRAMMGIGRALSPARFPARWVQPFLHGTSRPILKSLLLFQNHEIGDVNTSLFRYCIDNLIWLERGRDKKWLDLVAASTHHKHCQLQEYGFRSVFLPVGQQEVLGRDLGTPKDIDVLFIGSLKSVRRRRSLEHLRTELEALGHSLHVPSGRVYGEDRVTLVNRAKIMLHVQQFPSDTPWIRWLIASANGAVMASEPLVDPYPLIPDKDYLSAPLDRLAEHIHQLLSDEARLRDMLRSCRNTIENHMTLDISADRLASEIFALVDARKTSLNYRGP